LLRLAAYKSLAISIALVALVGISCSGQGTKEMNNTELGQLIYRAVAEHKFDEATKIGLDALQKRPNDGFILSQIAIIYLRRAQVDATQREIWLRAAIEYARKEASLDVDKESNLFNAAKAYDAAGDITQEKKCEYYGVAIQYYRDAGIERESIEHSGDRNAVAEAFKKAAREANATTKQKAASKGCATTPMQVVQK
jgi:hypothetical protein